MSTKLCLACGEVVRSLWLKLPLRENGHRFIQSMSEWPKCIQIEKSFCKFLVPFIHPPPALSESLSTLHSLPLSPSFHLSPQFWHNELFLVSKLMLFQDCFSTELLGFLHHLMQSTKAWMDTKLEFNLIIPVKLSIYDFCFQDLFFSTFWVS